MVHAFKALSKAFKLIFHQIQSFYEKSHFCSSFSQFWIIEIPSPLLKKIEKINFKAKVKSVSTFDFSTFYTKLPDFDLKCVE